MQRILTLTLTLTLTLAFVTVFMLGSPAEAQQRKWIGMLAVMESPVVNQVIRDSGNEPALYGPVLRQLLDSGQIQPATGQFCFIPYRGGYAAERPECFTTNTGIYTMWAPGEMVRSGRSMCVRVPSHWPAIAGQLRYPEHAGHHVNCYDFNGVGAGFASTRDTAAMVVVVQPRG